MRYFLATVALFAVAGCMQPNPTVSERNSAGITIQTAPNVAPPIAISSAQMTANRYCNSGNKSANYLDTRLLSNGGAEHYFSCT